MHTGSYPLESLFFSPCSDRWWWGILLLHTTPGENHFPKLLYVWDQSDFLTAFAALLFTPSWVSPLLSTAHTRHSLREKLCSEGGWEEKCLRSQSHTHHWIHLLPASPSKPPKKQNYPKQKHCFLSLFTFSFLPGTLPSARIWGGTSGSHYKFHTCHTRPTVRLGGGGGIPSLCASCVFLGHFIEAWHALLGPSTPMHSAGFHEWC